MLHKLGSTYSYYVVFLATRMMIFREVCLKNLI